MPLSAEQADLTRQALIENGVLPSEAEEVIESMRSEFSKGDDANATKTPLQKISVRMAEAVLGASAHPDKIANQANEIYEVLFDCIKKAAAGISVGGGGIVGITVVEKVGGEPGKLAKGIRGLLNDIGGQKQTPTQPTPTARPHPQQPPRRHESPHTAQPTTNRNNRGISDEELSELVPGADKGVLRQFERDHLLNYTIEQRIKYFINNREAVLRRSEEKRILSRDELWERVHGSRRPVDQAEMSTLYGSYGQKNEGGIMIRTTRNASATYRWSPRTGNNKDELHDFP